MRHYFYLILIFTFFNSCKEKKEVKKAEVVKTVPGNLTVLEGKYDEKEDVWVNPNPLYTKEIQFDGDEYAVFSRVDEDDNSLGAGLIDKTGKVFVQPIYTGGVMVGFQDGFCSVSNIDGKQGLINVKGEVIAEPIYDNLLYTDEFYKIDSTMIRVTKDDKCGFINRSGKIVVPIKYNSLVLAGKNRIMFMTEPAKWGIMDYQGKVLFPPEFTHTNIFENGKMNLQKEGGDNYIVYMNGKIEKE